MAKSADLLFPGTDIQPTLTTINNAILIIYQYVISFIFTLCFHTDNSNFKSVCPRQNQNRKDLKKKTIFLLTITVCAFLFDCIMTVCLFKATELSIKQVSSTEFLISFDPPYAEGFTHLIQTITPKKEVWKNLQSSTSKDNSTPSNNIKRYEILLQIQFKYELKLNKTNHIIHLHPRSSVCDKYSQNISDLK